MLKGANWGFPFSVTQMCGYCFITKGSFVTCLIFSNMKKYKSTQTGWVIKFNMSARWPWILTVILDASNPKEAFCNSYVDKLVCAFTMKTDPVIIILNDVTKLMNNLFACVIRRSLSGMNCLILHCYEGILSKWKSYVCVPLLTFA